jgi:hypothetical protein
VKAVLLCQALFQAMKAWVKDFKLPRIGQPQ